MLKFESMEVRLTNALCATAAKGAKGRRTFLHGVGYMAFGAFAGIAAMSKDALAFCQLFPLNAWPCGDEPEGPEEKCDGCTEDFDCQGPPAGVICPEGYTHFVKDYCGDPVVGCPHQFGFSICQNEMDEEDFCYCAYDLSCCCSGGA